MSQAYTGSAGAAPVDGTSGYNVGDLYLVGGSDIGGSAAVNDAYVSVSSVNGQGGITGLSISGTGTDANVDYVGVTWSTGQSGASAVIDINRTGATYTATFTNTGTGFASCTRNNVVCTLSLAINTPSLYLISNKETSLFGLDN